MTSLWWDKSQSQRTKNYFLHNNVIFRLWSSDSCIYTIRETITIAAWWRHQMETFSALLAICAGNLPVPGEFPAQRPVTRSFDVFFDLRPNKRLRKQSWGWWFETLSRPLWRHRNGTMSNKWCTEKGQPQETRMDMWPSYFQHFSTTKIAKPASWLGNGKLHPRKTVGCSWSSMP